MKPTTLINFFNERNLSLIESLSNASEDDLKETIHKLRVDFKKIHFLFLFINYFNHNKNIQHLYKPYRKIFKSSGVVRELHLKRKLLEEFDETGESIAEQNKLHKKEKKISKKFFNSINSHLKEIRAIHEKSLIIFEKFPVFNETDFLNNLSSQVKEQFTKINPAHLHESRKTLKAVIYSKQLFPHAAVFRKVLNAKVADDLQDLIGSWHDKIVLFDWMNENLKSRDYLTVKSVIKDNINNDFKEIRQVSAGLFKGEKT
jgi:CHAD domain-containing protein